MSKVDKASLSTVVCVDCGKELAMAALCKTCAVKSGKYAEDKRKIIRINCVSCNKYLGAFRFAKFDVINPNNIPVLTDHKDHNVSYEVVNG